MIQILMLLMINNFATILNILEILDDFLSQLLIPRFWINLKLLKSLNFQSNID